jgi:hypothetical protein
MKNILRTTKSINLPQAIEDEPNHLDFKVRNKFDEWVWKSPNAIDRYASLWKQWHKHNNKGM